MEESIIYKFFEEKSNNYKEPQRKGTSRGEPVGFSRVKYNASLLIITRTKRKEIAEGLGISYALLRKWNSEKAFKAMVLNNCTEFTGILVKQINEFADQFDLYTRHITDQEPSRKTINKIIEEASMYGKCVIHNLWQLYQTSTKMMAEMESNPNLKDRDIYDGSPIPGRLTPLGAFNLILKQILTSGGKLSKKEWGKELEDLAGIRRNTVIESINRIKNLIKENYISRADKEFISEFLGFIEGYIRERG